LGQLGPEDDPLNRPLNHHNDGQISEETGDLAGDAGQHSEKNGLTKNQDGKKDPLNPEVLCIGSIPLLIVRQNDWISEGTTQQKERFAPRSCFERGIRDAGEVAHNSSSQCVSSAGVIRGIARGDPIRAHEEPIRCN
jgi:hypothetical protein